MSLLRYFHLEEILLDTKAQSNNLQWVVPAPEQMQYVFCLGGRGNNTGFNFTSPYIGQFWLIDNLHLWIMNSQVNLRDLDYQKNNLHR